jgi:hypothetical protein
MTETKSTLTEVLKRFEDKNLAISDYDIVLAMEGRRLTEVNPDILSRANYGHYQSGKNWYNAAHHSFPRFIGDKIVDLAMTPIRLPRFLYYRRRARANS